MKPISVKTLIMFKTLICVVTKQGASYVVLLFEGQHLLVWVLGGLPGGGPCLDKQQAKSGSTEFRTDKFFPDAMLLRWTLA